MLLTQVSTDDPDTAIEATRLFFPDFTATPGEEPARFQLAGHRASGLTFLDYSMTGMDAHLETTSEEFGVCELDLEGRMTTGRDTLDSVAPFALPPVMAADVVRVHSLVLQIDTDDLVRFARNTTGLDRLELRMLRYSPVSPDAAAHWRAVAKFARAQIVDGSADNPLIGASLQQLVMAAYLHAFPSTWSDSPTPRDGARPVPASLRRAIAYMEEHASGPVTLTDIAEAARLTPRGLTDAFRRVLDTTPTAYLRRLRLDGARTDLLAGDPSQGATVADIAARWGFAHLGRFAARYAEAYGESPSATLRR